MEHPREGRPDPVGRPPSDGFLLEGGGCFLPILVGGIGLGLGWWTVGMWAGLGGWIGGGALGLWLLFRFRRGSDFGSLGCVSGVVLLLIALLIPAVQMIRDAAERMRTEHELRQQKSPPPPEEPK